MTTRPPADMRRQVIDRAQGWCEYCLIVQQLTAFSHQVDYVIAEKHGGQTILDNLALSCMTCNLRKGSDIASLDPESGELIALFHPRTQHWNEHFRLDDATFVGLTATGRTTIEFLQLNADDRVTERYEFMLAGVYPPRSMSRKPK